MVKMGFTQQHLGSYFTAFAFLFIFQRMNSCRLDEVASSQGCASEALDMKACVPPLLSSQTGISDISSIPTGTTTTLVGILSEIPCIKTSSIFR